MRTLKRSECSILPLVLKGKWYDMMASGVKRVVNMDTPEEIADAVVELTREFVAKARAEIGEGGHHA